MRHATLISLAATMLAAAALNAQADVITDWIVKAGDIVVESRLGTPPAIRVMAIIQSAVHEAVSAVAAASRAALAQLIPSQQASS